MAFSLQIPYRKRPKGWTVVDGQDGLLGVTVDTSGKTCSKPRMVHHAQVALTEAAAVGDFQQLAQALGKPKFPVMALLQRSQYQIFLVDKAQVHAEEMLQSLRWTLSTLLDYPPEEANLAWMDVPVKSSTARNEAKMHVIAAKTSSIDQHMSCFEKAHLGLAVVDIRESGQANLAQCVESTSSGVCLIFADPLGLQITVTFQGDLYLERFIRESLFDEPDGTSPGQRKLKFDRIALEIQRSMDFLRRNFPALNVDLFFVGPTAQEIGLLAELGQRLPQHLQPFDLSDFFEWPVGSEMTQPQVQALYFHALGASLRASP